MIALLGLRPYGPYADFARQIGTRRSHREESVHLIRLNMRSAEAESQCCESDQEPKALVLETGNDRAIFCGVCDTVGFYLP